MKLKTLLIENTQNTIEHYGLMLFVGATSRVEYDDFESTEVFVNKQNFIDAITTAFYEYDISENAEREEKFPRGSTSFDVIKESQEFQDFINDQVWIVDKLGVL